MTKSGKSEFLSNRVQYYAAEEIHPNSQQPRRDFDPNGLRELAQSIGEYGILQPLTVRRTERGLELIAGERRLRAARLAGLRQVPCIVARVGEEDAGMLALIENLQRRDLHYLEEAKAMAQMICRYDLTQEQVAQKLGRSQSSVANKLRLLRLPPEVCALLTENHLTERHARALLRLSDPQEQCRSAEHMAKEKLNVAQAEEYVEKVLHRLAHTPPEHRSTYILKDVRLFLNSVQRQVRLLEQSGIPAVWQRQDTPEAVILTISIPKHGEKGSAEK